MASTSFLEYVLWKHIPLARLEDLPETIMVDLSKDNLAVLI